MVELYLYLFIAVCFALLFWGMIRLERIYQYPFFMGATFTVFILPQAFSIYENPGEASPTALSRVFLMSALCAGMCWLGYQFAPNPKWLKTVSIELDESKLFLSGITLTGISYFCSFMLLITEKTLADNSNWTGISTVYYFFSKVIYIAFIIFILRFLKKPSFKNLTWLIISSLPIASAIFLSGRRTATGGIIILIGMLMWFARGYLPSRLFVILLIFIAAYLIPTLAQTRENFWQLVLSNQWSSVLSSSQDSFDKVIQGDVLELRNAALIMDAAAKTGKYGYGTGYWDAFVFQYVPGQFLGHAFKKALQLNWTDYSLNSIFNYYIPSGSTKTGIGDSFVEFDYFGCLIFGFIGMLLKHLWLLATYKKNTFSIMFYSSLVIPAILAITHGTQRAFQDIIFQLIFFSLIILFCKKRTISSRYYHQTI